MGTYTTLKLREPCVFQFFAGDRIQCRSALQSRSKSRYSGNYISFLQGVTLQVIGLCYCRVPSDIGAVYACTGLKVARVDGTRSDKLLFNSNERIRMKIRTIAVVIADRLMSSNTRERIVTCDHATRHSITNQ